VCKINATYAYTGTPLSHAVHNHTHTHTCGFARTHPFSTVTSAPKTKISGDRHGSTFASQMHIKTTKIWWTNGLGQ